MKARPTTTVGSDDLLAGNSTEDTMTATEIFKSLVPDVPLPWSCGAGADDDKIVDADGCVIAQFYGPERDARQAMLAVICAVNTCAGYKAELPANA